MKITFIATLALVGASLASVPATAHVPDCTDGTDCTSTGDTHIHGWHSPPLWEPQVPWRPGGWPWGWQAPPRPYPVPASYLPIGGPIYGGYDNCYPVLPPYFGGRW